MEPDLEDILKAHSASFDRVVSIEPSKDALLFMDFTESNMDLKEVVFQDTQTFSDYVRSQLQRAGARYGVGGYAEHRVIYSRSSIFGGASPRPASEGKEAADAQKPKQKTSSDKELQTDETVQRSTFSKPNEAEARRVHLGIDIWGSPHSKVIAPLDGMVHSFAFNNAFGDYGATIILSHQLQDVSFYTLYGHLSLASIKNLQEGVHIQKGNVFAEFGIPQENGNWPPHLHFQLIKDLQGMKGDYPGVCRFSEKEIYLKNCPDPDLILGMVQYAVPG